MAANRHRMQRARGSPFPGQQLAGKDAPNLTWLRTTFSGRTGPDPPEDLSHNRARSMRQTLGASRRRTCCVRQPEATETAMAWATPPDRRGATSGARSGVAHAMVSCPNCDTDAGSGRQRAPPVSGTFRAPHDEVSEHERDTGRRKVRAPRRSLADRETPASIDGGRPHFRRSALRSSSSVGCQATSTKGERWRY